MVSKMIRKADGRWSDKQSTGNVGSFKKRSITMSQSSLEPALSSSNAALP